MQYSISHITYPKGRKSIFVRFTLTIAENDVDMTKPDSVTVQFDGCLAGVNAVGAWAWPSQQQGSNHKVIRWSKEFENEVLWALREKGELGGKGV